MQYPHTPDQAKSYAEQAAERIRKEGLLATPDNFQLWYIYYSGMMPEVRRALDIVFSKNKAVSDQHCREIYQRFLTNRREEDSVRKAGEEINRTIETVSGYVREVQSSATEYNESLEAVNGRLREDALNPDDMREILDTVVSDTEKMLHQNQELERQLDQSARIMETLQREMESVRREALTDGLTGLSNRKAFDLDLERVIKEAQESKKTFCLLLLDVDHFKKFNDTFGHQVGDQVLRLTARTMVEGVKGRDIVARFGGEEFAIILPETNVAAGMTVGDALRKSIAVKEIINRNTNEKLGKITVSIGVAEYIRGESPEAVIGRADAALYMAKRKGRDICVMATPEMLELAKQTG